MLRISNIIFDQRFTRLFTGFKGIYNTEKWGSRVSVSNTPWFVCLSPLSSFTYSVPFSSNILLPTPPNLCLVLPSLSLESHNTKILVCSLLQEPKNLVGPYWPSKWHTKLSHALTYVSWSPRSLWVSFSILSLSPCPGPSMGLSLYMFVTSINELLSLLLHNSLPPPPTPSCFSSILTWISGFPSTYTVLLLTISTMATPRLHRIPKEMQNPSPLMMAMMYRLGMPQQLQSQTGRRGLDVCTGLPSSSSSMLSSSSLVPSIFLHHTKNRERIRASVQGEGECTK